MSILVTGGAGYIGSHMVWHLVDAGEDVIVLDNLSSGFRWAVAPEAHFVHGDCGDEALVGHLIKEHGVEAIVHFAGSVVVPESVAHPLRYYLNNTVKTRALIASAVAGGVGRFIFSSTAAVYGTPAVTPVGEDAALLPESPYGRSKLMSETMLADTAAAHDFRYVALRYFNVAGADPRGRTGQSTKGATHLIKVGGGDRARQARGDHRLRHRLPDAGWHLHSRLHPRRRPRRCARRGPGLPARWRRQPRRQLRLRSRLLGAGGDRHGQAGLGA